MDLDLTNIIGSLVGSGAVAFAAHRGITTALAALAKDLSGLREDVRSMRVELDTVTNRVHTLERRVWRFTKRRPSAST